MIQSNGIKMKLNLNKIFDIKLTLLVLVSMLIEQNTSAEFKMLDQLQIFLSSEDQVILEKIAGNHEYCDKLTHIPYKGLPSEKQLKTYLNADTCNVLYYGLIQGILSEDEFMESYHTLMIYLFFFPGNLPEAPLNSVPALAEDITTVYWGDIPPYLKNTQPLLKKGTPLINLFFDTDQKPSYYFLKITLTNEFGAACAKGILGDRKQYCSNLEIAHFIIWIDILSYNVPGIYLDRESKKSLYIPSFALQKALLQYITVSEYGQQRSVAMKPVFGACDWEQLKTMRFKNQHPLGLWHPMIKSSQLQPDGYWFSVLAYLHDIYHVSKLNQITLRNRNNYLNKDNIFNRPIVMFLERIIKVGIPSDKSLIQDIADKIFIDGLEQQFREISFTLVCDEMSEYLLEPYPWQLPENLKQYYYPRYNEDFSFPASLTITTTNTYRRLVDQEQIYTQKYTNHIKERSHFNMFKPTPWHISLTTRLAYNAVVFQSVIHKKHSKDYRFCACDIKEHPKERNTLNEMAASPERRPQLESFCKDHPDTVDRWHIDWWVRYLADKHVPLQ